MRSPASPIAACIGENLARARKRADLSQEELGVMASLHRTEISLLERGTRLPRIDTVIKLAGALEIPLDQLIEGDRVVAGEHGGGSVQRARAGRGGRWVTSERRSASQPAALTA